MKNIIFPLYIFTVLFLAGCGGGLSEKGVAVLPASVDFTYTADNLTVKFYSVVKNAGDDPKYSWSFGDGASSDEASPAHTYASEGTYQVFCSVTLPGGSSATVKKTVVVYANGGESVPPVPGIDFSYTVDGLKADFSSAAENAGDDPAYSWSFGDGASSNEASPTHTYASAGTYRVSCTITLPGGSSATVKKTVVVYANGGESVPPVPGIDFSYTADGLKAVFTSVVENAGGGNPVYGWSFGDGELSSEANPTHAYASAGDYEVSCTITLPGGLSATVSKTVTVSAGGGVPPLPFVDFSYTADGLKAAFTSVVENAGDDPVYGWSFGDGELSSEANPTHAYASAGDYEVSCTITLPGGLSATVSKTVTVSAGGGVPPLPFVDFSYTADGLKAAFTSVAENTDDDPVYNWSFGDGEVSSEANPTHVYASAGTYRARLTVILKDGREFSAEKDVELAGRPGETDPVTADFTFEVSGLQAAFKADVRNGDNKRIDYLWDFNGGENISYEKDPVYVFSGPGRKQVTLKVFIDGNADGPLTVTKTVIVFSAEPVKLFIYKADGGEPDKNPDYIYFALRVKGTSPGGDFYQYVTLGDDPDRRDAYPRDLEYIDANGQYINFLSKEMDGLCGLGYCIGGYDEATGFANAAGTEMDMPFYLGVNNFRVKINGGRDAVYYFNGFSVVDRSIPIWGGFSYPSFIRFSQSSDIGKRFKITVPMASYNPAVHKNIVKLTVNFTNNGAEYPYEIIFDGFEPK